MGIVDYIAIAAIALVIGAAVFYIVRAKRSGQKCIGCPYAKGCGGNCNGGCSQAEADKDNGEK